MKQFHREGLSHDPVHGHILFSSSPTGGESAERDLIDHPWLQRLRQIHQLQTAWWVFPSAEHTRFQHVLGVMHLASRAVQALYDSLAESCRDVPSRGYVESLVRIAGLLHDVGHGPFGHFLDEHFLSDYGLTHETLGSQIISRELGEIVIRIRRNPNGELSPDETLEPSQIAYLITRPLGPDAEAVPTWLSHLRGLFSGLYTVDNMDFVLRDAYMSGYSTRSFDLERLLHYSFFSEKGLTIHARGLPALVRFLSVRAELFRSLYFHRTVRSIDLTLAELFADSKSYLFSGNPADKLDEYRRFTEWSLLVDVARWHESVDPRKRELGERWTKFLNREVRWKMAAERTVFFDPTSPEGSSIFSKAAFFESALRELLPADVRGMPLRVDLARHVHRPGTRGPAAGQNFLFDPSHNEIRSLTDHELYRQIPVSYRICRVYAETTAHNALLSQALDTLVGPGGADDLTNM